MGTDETFDYDTSLNACYDNNGKDYFFKNVKSIFEADDLTIANFEGTLTDSDEREDKEYAFKAPAEYTSILTAGSVEAVNTANNHSHDYGEKSYTDTISALEDAGIASFGYNRIKILKIKGIKVGVTGIYELADHQKRASQVKQNIKALKKAGAQVIIVNFHWGIEKQYTPIIDFQYFYSHRITNRNNCCQVQRLIVGVFTLCDDTVCFVSDIQDDLIWLYIDYSSLYDLSIVNSFK